MELGHLLYLLAVPIGLVVSYHLYQIIHNIFFSPLRHIPGPWWAGITSLPKAYQTAIRMRSAQWNHQLHLRYGSYVRVAPNEVLIADVDAYRQIHRINTPFLKSTFYSFLNTLEPGEGPFGLFAEIDPTRHASRRKLFSKGFSVKTLRAEWEPVVSEKASKAVQSMQQEAVSTSSGQVDMLKWWFLFAGDVISELMFGDSFNGLDTGKPDPLFDAIGQNIVGHLIAYNSPFLYSILKRIPIPSWYLKFNGHKIIAERGRVAVNNSRSTSSSRNIFTGMLEQSEIDKTTDSNTQPITDDEICAQAATFVVGGTDTTANTLTYLIWAVLMDKTGLQAAIEAEVATLGEIFTDEQVATLPLFNATISESLRLYPAVPAPLPRVSPPGGVHFGGYFFPAGTVVQSQAYTLHRQPDIFPDGERFNPQQWLSPNTAHLNKHNIAFGSGSRACIGIHLAMMELRLAAALFFRKCRGARLAAGTTRESMEMENTMLMAPAGHRCDVVLPGRV